MSFVSESDRVAHVAILREQQKRKAPRSARHRSETTVFINDHRDQIINLVKDAVSTSRRKRTEISSVCIVLLTKRKLPWNPWLPWKNLEKADRVLLRHIKKEEPKTASVRIGYHWWNPVGNGNKRYDITVSFKPSLT